MLVKLRREILESLNDDDFGWECIKPIVIQVRGKDSATKTQVYSQLTRGQKASFMFRVFYNHAGKSLADFYWWSAYFLSQSTWSEIKAGLQCFNDDLMLKVLIETEDILHEMDRQGTLTVANASINDLDHNPEFSRLISQLYEKFQKTAPTTHQLIREYIRKNIDEFVQVVE